MAYEAKYTQIMATLNERDEFHEEYYMKYTILHRIRLHDPTGTKFKIRLVNRAVYEHILKWSKDFF